MPGNWLNAPLLAAGIVNFQEFLYCESITGKEYTKNIRARYKIPQTSFEISKNAATWAESIGGEVILTRRSRAAVMLWTLGRHNIKCITV